MSQRNIERIRRFLQDFVETMCGDEWFVGDEDLRLELVFDEHEWFTFDVRLSREAKPYLEGLASVGRMEVVTRREEVVEEGARRKLMVEREMHVGPYRITSWAYEVPLSGDREKDEDARLRAEIHVLPYPPQVFDGLGSPVPGLDQDTIVSPLLVVPEFSDEDEEDEDDA